MHEEREIEEIALFVKNGNLKYPHRQGMTKLNMSRNPMLLIGIFNAKSGV